VRPYWPCAGLQRTAYRRWQFWLRRASTFRMAHAECGCGCNFAHRIMWSSFPWTAVRAVDRRCLHERFADAKPSHAAGRRRLFNRPLRVHRADAAPQPTPLLGSFVGTGAFEGSWILERRSHSDGNDSCWEGRPFLDKIEVTATSRFRDQWLDLSLGRADLVEFPPSSCARPANSGSPSSFRAQHRC